MGPSRCLDPTQCYMNEEVVTEELNNGQRSRGGRPKKPPAPVTLEDCLRCIALEIAKPKSKQDTKKLRQLQSLRKGFEGIEQRKAEVAERVARNAEAAAQAEKNRLEAEEVGLRRAEYQRRKELGDQSKELREENKRLKEPLQKQFELVAQNRKLDELLRRAKSEIETRDKTIDAQEKEISRLNPFEADSAELHKIQNAVKAELTRTGDPVARLREELNTLQAQQQTMPVLERELEITKMLRVLVKIA